jgi:DedD protein
VERHVKERLVGAAVLMAAAVILIPEMLSGPDREPAPEAVRTADDNGIKTYTIDLGDASASTQKVEVQSAPPQEPASAAPDSSTAPPSAPAKADQTFPESVAPSASASPSSSTEASQQTARNVPDAERERAVARTEPATAQPTVPPQAAQGSTSRALASEPAVPTSRGWAVQLGSFSNRDSAERLAREFQAERYDAFVMPVKSGAATLYRVRLGPMKDRSAAEEALKRAKVKVSGAAVVAHP